MVDPACAIRLSRRKVLFSGLKFINMTPLNYDSIENSQICPSTPIPDFKRGGHRPPHFKNCSAGPVLKLLARDFCNIFYHLPRYIYRLFRKLSKILIFCIFCRHFWFLVYFSTYVIALLLALCQSVNFWCCYPATDVLPFSQTLRALLIFLFIFIFFVIALLRTYCLF